MDLNLFIQIYVTSWGCLFLCLDYYLFIIYQTFFYFKKAYLLVYHKAIFRAELKYI